MLRAKVSVALLQGHGNNKRLNITCTGTSWTSSPLILIINKHMSSLIKQFSEQKFQLSCSKVKDIVEGQMTHIQNSVNSISPEPLIQFLKYFVLLRQRAEWRFHCQGFKNKVKARGQRSHVQIFFPFLISWAPDPNLWIILTGFHLN